MVLHVIWGKKTDQNLVKRFNNFDNLLRQNISQFFCYCLEQMFWRTSVTWSQWRSEQVCSFSQSLPTLLFSFHWEQTQWYLATGGLSSTSTTSQIVLFTFGSTKIFAMPSWKTFAYRDKRKLYYNDVTRIFVGVILT